MFFFVKNEARYKPKKPVSNKKKDSNSEANVKDQMDQDFQSEKSEYYEKGVNTSPVNQSEIDVLKSKATIFVEEAKADVSARINDLELRWKEKVDRIAGYLKKHDESILGLDHVRKKQAIAFELGLFSVSSLFFCSNAKKYSTDRISN